MTLSAAYCLKGGHALGGPILAFLLSAAYLEAPEEAASRLGLAREAAGLASSWWPALTDSPRALARLSLFFASGDSGPGTAWLPDFLATDFSARPARLLLLPPPALAILGRYAGVALHYREAAALLAREEVLAFREALGPAARDFAVRRAPFLLGEPERLARALAGEREVPGVRDLIARVNRAARAALAACAGTLAPPLARLFLAKLPPEDGKTGAAGPVALDEAAWYSLEALLGKLLAKEVELKPWAGFC